MAESGLKRFIAIHKTGTEAFNRGDLDAALAVFPEDAEWHAVTVDPDSSVLRGPDEIKGFFEGFRDVFEEWRSEVLGYEEIEEGTALVHHVIRGTSRGAGVPVEVDTWDVWEVDEDMHPIRVRQFLTREEAMEAAG
jgi:ketosteroid isomerase-like protein